MNYSEELLQFGAQKLKNAKIKSCVLDSELILSHLLNLKREDLLVRKDIPIPNNIHKKFINFLDRRTRKEPVAYILNEREFWKHIFYVDKNTLIPRPETELMIEKIIKYFKKSRPRILDIGTGTGCIIISLLNELEYSRGVGIDPSKKALSIAKRNASKFKLNNRLRFFNQSIENFSAFGFDLIVSNPPYIARNQLKNLMDDVKNFEPKIALDGGNDGLDVIRKVIYKSKTILKYNGLLALEIGHGQYKKVSQILKNYKFREKFLIKDYRDNIRCVLSISNK